MSRKNRVRKPKPLSPEERAEGRARETLETIRWFAPLVGRVLAMDDAVDEGDDDEVDRFPPMTVSGHEE